MTHPTDEELDALVERAADAIDRVKPAGILSNNAKLSVALFALYDLLPAITALRTQLADVQAELSRRVDMHECAMAERDDATLYGVEQKARADRAEAALAAQIEVDSDVAEAERKIWDRGYNTSSAGFYVCRSLANVRDAIRAQPHDRTALDRMLAEAREQALRDAADEMEDERAKQAILALIEKP